MIEGQSLYYQYPDGNGISFPDFSFEQGSQWLIIGPSGSGKTTLLQLLAGLRKPTNGSLRMHGKRIDQYSAAELDKHRGSEIGIVFQKGQFVNSLSVGDNLLLAQYLGGKKQDEKLCMDMIASLGLKDKWRKKMSSLSQGERQRISLARALVKSPRVLLADEPSSALDDENTERVVELIKSQAKEVGATLIIVTHDQRLKDNFQHKIELT